MPQKILTFVLALTACIVRADDIGVFYALDADFEALKSEAVVARQPAKIGEHQVQILLLGKHKVYATKMGSGAVETALAGEAMLGSFHCDRAFSIGPVGALSDGLESSKWYEVHSVVAYQKGSWTSSGFQLSKLSRLDNVSVRDIALKMPQLFKDLEPISVASGEIFISSTRYREEMRSVTHADAVDMNLFGLTSACVAHHVPLLSWRIVSDEADDNAAEDFRKFTQRYDGAGGKAVAELIRNLPANPNSPESYPALQKLLKPNDTPKK